MAFGPYRFSCPSVDLVGKYLCNVCGRFDDCLLNVIGLYPVINMLKIFVFVFSIGGSRTANVPRLIRLETPVSSKF